MNHVKGEQTILTDGHNVMHDQFNYAFKRMWILITKHAERQIRELHKAWKDYESIKKREYKSTAIYGRFGLYKPSISCCAFILSV